MYRAILLPLDLAEASASTRMLSVGRELAQRLGTSLALATVVPDHALVLGAQWSAIAYRELLDISDARLGAIADTVTGVGRVTHHVETGSIWRGILTIAERIGADLILLGAHRPIMRDYLLGTNSAQVVRHARCSVLVFRGAEGA